MYAPLLTHFWSAGAILPVPALERGMDINISVSLHQVSPQPPGRPQFTGLAGCRKT